MAALLLFIIWPKPTVILPLTRNTKTKAAALFAKRAEAKTELYDFAGALADYDKAIDLIADGGYFKSRATLHFEMGDWERAVADWKRAEELGAADSLLQQKHFEQRFSEQNLR